MLHTISSPLRSLVFAFNEPITERLRDFAYEANKNPKAIADKAENLFSILDNAIQAQSSLLLKDKNRSVPLALTPSTLQGQVRIRDIIVEALTLYKTLKTQIADLGQQKFITKTIDKLIECFDAISKTLKDA